MKNNISQRGFSLPELLIVVAIFVTLSVLMLISYNSFSSRIVLENKAHEIAQTIREAQVYAMGVKGSASAGFPGYGVYFDKNSPGSFIFFRDLTANPNDQAYDNIIGTCGDTAGGMECLKVISLPKGMVFDYANFRVDGPSPAGSIPDSFSIVFTRPKPDAEIMSGGTKRSNVEIPVKSAKGERRVVVYSTGQISVR